MSTTISKKIAVGGDFAVAVFVDMSLRTDATEKRTAHPNGLALCFPFEQQWSKPNKWLSGVGRVPGKVAHTKREDTSAQSQKHSKKRW